MASGHVTRTRSRSGFEPSLEKVSNSGFFLDMAAVVPPPNEPPPEDLPPVSPPRYCAFVKMAEAGGKRSEKSKTLRRGRSYTHMKLNLSEMPRSLEELQQQLTERAEIHGQTDVIASARSANAVLLSPRYRHHPYIGQLAPLLELLVRPSEPLLEALEVVGNESNQNEFIAPVIAVYACTGYAQPFLVRMIREELEVTPNEACLFRGYSFTLQYISAYWRGVGKSYLRQVLQPLVLLVLSKKESLEMDPNRVENVSQIKVNTLNLMVTCREAFEHIRDSIYLFPVEMQMLCHRIYNLTEAKFPTSGLLAVGAVCFLRLFCPAIVSPENFGLLTEDVVVTARERRHLVLVSKVLQTLANLHVRFGEKEQYMVPMNVFLRNFNIDMKKLLTTMSMPPISRDEKRSPRQISSRDVYALHHILWDQRNEIVAELAKKKQNLCNIFEDFIMEVGEPMAVSQFESLERGKESRVISRIDDLSKVKKQTRKMAKSRR